MVTLSMTLLRKLLCRLWNNFFSLCSYCYNPFWNKLFYFCIHFWHSTTKLDFDRFFFAISTTPKTSKNILEVQVYMNVFYISNIATTTIFIRTITVTNTIPRKRKTYGRSICYLHSFSQYSSIWEDFSLLRNQRSQSFRIRSMLTTFHFA